MPDATSSLLAMYQQLLGGSSARENTAMEAACAQRVVSSGLTIGPTGTFSFPGALVVGGALTVSGALTVGSFSAVSFSVTNLAVTGLITATGLGTHQFVGAYANAGQQLVLANSASGAMSYTQFSVGNDANFSLLQLLSYASNFTSGGISKANGSAMVANGAGGLAIAALGSGTPTIEVWFNTGKKWTFDSSGNFTAGINGVGNLFTVHAQGSSAWGNAGNTSFTVINFNNANGIVGSVVTNGSATAYNTSSDARLKIDRGVATDLSRLRALSVRDFTWKDGEDDRGLFAQHVKEYPFAVTAGDDTNVLEKPWQLDYSKFVADLIAGWQEHDQRLTRLERTVEPGQDLR